MRDESDFFTDRFDGEVEDVPAIDQHLALLHLIEPLDEFQDGALSCTGVPHDSEERTCVDGERDIVQHIGLCARIGECDSVEGERCNRLLQIHRIR